MSEHPPSSIVWDIAKGAYFSLTSSRVLNHELQAGEMGRVWEDNFLSFFILFFLSSPLSFLSSFSLLLSIPPPYFPSFLPFMQQAGSYFSNQGWNLNLFLWKRSNHWTTREVPLPQQRKALLSHIPFHFYTNPICLQASSRQYWSLQSIFSSSTCSK